MTAADDPEYPDVDGLVLDGETLSFPEARIVTVVRSELHDCTLAVPDDAKLDVVDSTLDGVDLTGRRVEGLQRTTLAGCRLGGADLGDAVVRQVRFEDCVLDLASFRGAELLDVTVAGGRVDETDLSGARLQDVTFIDVDLSTATLAGARLEAVDLTRAGLEGITDLSTIRGATISGAQAVALAARLARAAGITVAPMDG